MVPVIIPNLSNTNRVINVSDAVYNITTPSSIQSWLTNSLIQSYLNLNQLGSQDNIVIPSLIADAFTACESFLNFTLFTTQIEASFNSVGSAYELNKPPIIELGSISLNYYNGVDYTPYNFGNSLYTNTGSVGYEYINIQNQNNKKVTLTLNPPASANLTVCTQSDTPPIIINFTAGYDSVSALQTLNSPLYNAMTMAMYSHVAYCFQFRGDHGIPPSPDDDTVALIIKNKLSPFTLRKLRLGGNITRQVPQNYSTNTQGSV